MLEAGQLGAARLEPGLEQVHHLSADRALACPLIVPAGLGHAPRDRLRLHPGRIHGVLGQRQLASPLIPLDGSHPQQGVDAGLHAAPSAALDSAGSRPTASSSWVRVSPMPQGSSVGCLRKARMSSMWFRASSTAGLFPIL